MLIWFFEQRVWVMLAGSEYIHEDLGSTPILLNKVLQHLTSLIEQPQLLLVVNRLIRVFQMLVLLHIIDNFIEDDKFVVGD